MKQGLKRINTTYIHTYIYIYIYTLVCVCVCVKLISSSQQPLVRVHVMQVPRTKKYLFIGKIQLEPTILPSPPYSYKGGEESFELELIGKDQKILTFALLALEIHHFPLYSHCSLTSLLTNIKPQPLVNIKPFVHGFLCICSYNKQ